jgi:phosphohistidine phosphatase
MPELYLVRHADAGDPAAWAGSDDERPLSEQGRGQARRLGALFAAAGFSPHVILSSPKLRAVETAELLGQAVGVTVTQDERLAGRPGTATLGEVLAGAGNPARAVVVGHDPDLSDIASELVGAAIELKKCALARIDVRDGPAAGSGVLRWLIPPDALGR